MTLRGLCCLLYQQELLQLSGEGSLHSPSSSHGQPPPALLHKGSRCMRTAMPGSVTAYGRNHMSSEAEGHGKKTQHSSKISPQSKSCTTTDSAQLVFPCINDSLNGFPLVPKDLISKGSQPALIYLMRKVPHTFHLPLHAPLSLLQP